MIGQLPCTGGSRPTADVANAMNAATEHYGVHTPGCPHLALYVGRVMTSAYSSPEVMSG